MFCQLSQSYQYFIEAKLSKELKNGNGIVEGHTDQRIKILRVFWSIIQEHQTYLNFNAIFEFLGQFDIKIHIISQGVDNFEMEHKTC